MESPALPFVDRYKSLGYSVILILWWIGVWGIADTVIHMIFKGETMKELGVYIFLVASVLFLVVLHPELVARF